jgi:hypothetical protein
VLINDSLEKGRKLAPRVQFIGSAKNEIFVKGHDKINVLEPIFRPSFNLA